MYNLFTLSGNISEGECIKATKKTEGRYSVTSYAPVSTHSSRKEDSRRCRKGCTDSNHDTV